MKRDEGVGPLVHPTLNKIYTTPNVNIHRPVLDFYLSALAKRLQTAKRPPLCIHAQRLFLFLLLLFLRHFPVEDARRGRCAPLKRYRLYRIAPRVPFCIHKGSLQSHSNQNIS